MMMMIIFRSAAAVLFCCILVLSSLFSPLHGLPFIHDEDLQDKKWSCTNPDCFLPTPQLIESKGYKCETHYVTTEDGYILAMHRIPPTTPSSPVVFFQHGLEDASHGLVMNFAYDSLGYILHNEGFDVWLGNSRGNMYSTNHTTLNTSQDPFWEFSFDQMARYDLPSQLSYTLQYTGKSQLVYIGHSQGTLQAFIGFSTNATLAAQVSIFIAMAPIAYVGHITTILKDILILPDPVIYDLYGRKEFPKNITASHIEMGAVCTEDEAVCTDFFCLLYGCDAPNWNKSRYGVITSHNPAGSSVQNFVHFSQMFKNKKFCAMDYGIVGNYKHYGTPHPPNYNLTSLQIKALALFTGGHDDLADPRDVAELESQLPPSLGFLFKNYQPNYSHNDFTQAMNAYELIYPDIVQLARNFSLAGSMLP